MRDVCSLIWLALVGLFHSRVSLEAEILALRHQLNVLRRKSPKRPTFTIMDRLVFAGLYRLAPGMVDALAIVKPETVIRRRYHELFRPSGAFCQCQFLADYIISMFGFDFRQGQGLVEQPKAIDAQIHRQPMTDFRFGFRPRCAHVSALVQET
jgi:hypothetical protein